MQIGIMIEQELGKTIKIVPTTGPGLPGRYEVNIDNNSIIADANGILSTAYSIVFIDTEDPNTATIFSYHASPLENDASLKDRMFKIYRTPTGSAFVYDVDPGTGVGTYYQLGQSVIQRWKANGQTAIITLPQTPVNARIDLRINGVGYGDDYYTLAGNTLSWTGPFDIEPADIIDIFFF